VKRPKSSKRHASGCHPKLRGAQSKSGLTPIKKRNFKIWRLALHVAAEKCHWVWTDCGRVGDEQDRHRVEREEGDFERRFPWRLTDKELLRDNSDNTDDFVQAAMFNATTTFHTSRQVQQHRPVDFTQPHASTTSAANQLYTSPQFNNFASRQGASTPYLQQPTTTFHETATHMCLFDSFHQSQLVRGIGSRTPAYNRRQWARKGPGAR